MNGSSLYNGRSRTSPRRGHQSLRSVPIIILVIYSEKPYEITEILVCRGVHARCIAPKSATVVRFYERGILYIIISHVSEDDRIFTWHFHEPACVIVTHLDFYLFGPRKGTATLLFGGNPLIPYKLNIMKLLFSFPTGELFSLKPVFGACLYAVSNSGSLHTYKQTQRKVHLVLIVALQCLLLCM